VIAVVLAPTAAAIAASAFVAALGSRRPSVLGRVHEVRSARPRSLVDRVGSSPLFSRVVAGRRLASLLVAARSDLPVDRVVGVTILACASVALVAVWLGGPALLLAPFTTLAVLRVPVFVAARAARRRSRAIERDVPLLLDVLSLASFAGLPPPAALGRAVSAIDGPLADELAVALTDVELGARWRDRLTRVADELPLPDLRRAVALLVRSDAIGASTKEAIAILADDVRAGRRAAASERARKAPVQMLFPLVFLVLPAFLLLTVVPVLVATLGSIS
jgi:pilus assembly protein TadC